MRIKCQRDRYRYIRLTLRFINRTFNVDHNTNFCVDTGAPYSLITYEQAVQWNIPLNSLTATQSPHSVGGLECPGYILNDSMMLFRESNGKLHPIAVPKMLVLGEPFKKPYKPVPPLLGDDILRQFTLIVRADMHGGDIALTDENIQIVYPPIH